MVNFFVPTLSLSLWSRILCVILVRAGAPRDLPCARAISRWWPGWALIINLSLPKAGGAPLFVVVNINMRQWVAC